MAVIAANLATKLILMFVRLHLAGLERLVSRMRAIIFIINGSERGDSCIQDNATSKTRPRPPPGQERYS